MQSDPCKVLSDSNSVVDISAMLWHFHKHPDTPSPIKAFLLLFLFTWQSSHQTKPWNFKTGVLVAPQDAMCFSTASFTNSPSLPCFQFRAVSGIKSEGNLVLLLIFFRF